MGVDYTQYCILGLQVEECDIVTVVGEAEYEERPVYNTRTGKVSRMEKILVKDYEEYVEFLGCKDENVGELACLLENKYNDLKVFHDYEGGVLTIGYRIGDRRDFGRVNLIEGAQSIEMLVKLATKLAVRLECDSDQITLNHITDVG